MNSRFAWAALAAALAIALSGCGGDDGTPVDAAPAGDDAPAAEVLPADADGTDGIDADADGAVDSDDAGDGETVDGDDSGEDAGDAGEELDPLEEDVDALDAALLTLDDVPAGWDELEPQTDGAGICGFRLADGADGTARAAFSAPVGAPAVEQLVMRFGNGAGKDSFGDWVDAVKGCDEVTAVDRTFAVSPYEAQQRGDESAGVKLVSDDVTSYTVVIRRGDNLSSISWAALGEAGSADVETFAGIAAKRLGDAG